MQGLPYPEDSERPINNSRLSSAELDKIASALADAANLIIRLRAERDSARRECALLRDRVRDAGFPDP